MQFHYVAYDLEHGIVKGRIDAENEVEAWGEVNREGYKPLHIKRVRKPPGLEELFPTFFRVRTGELVRFARQLAIMVRGGSSLQRALEMLQSETNNRVLRRILTDIQNTLDSGGSLSGAMARYPAVFDPRFVSVMEVGEYTGNLAPALEQLADSLESQHEAAQKFKRTMMMPGFTMVASAGMLVLMLTVLLPPLLKTFERMGSDIPLITRIAIAMVGAIQHNLLAILLGAGVLVGLFWALRRIPTAQYLMHAAQMRIPLIGPLIVGKELSQISRTISMLLEAGVPLAMALPLSISGIKNMAIRKAMAAGEESLLSGHGFAEELERHSVLPRLWVELVKIGEESNSLRRAMADLADAYQKELETRLANLLTVAEPLSTVAVGGVVLFMALSMFLPIYGGLDAVR